MRRLRCAILPFASAAAFAVTHVYVANADEPVTAWADDVVSVDSSGFRTAVGTATLRCSPKWLSGEDGASYSLSVVADPDAANAATSSVPVSAATVEGDVTYAGSGYVRFILKASVGGVGVGDPLVQDVSFGVKSDSCASIAADSRASSLQERVLADSGAYVAYSTEWAEGSASVAVSVIGLSGKGGDATGTNTVFSTSSAEEDYAAVLGLDPGWCRLLFRAADSAGSTLLEYVTDEFRVRGGMVLLIK